MDVKCEFCHALFSPWKECTQVHVETASTSGFEPYLSPTYPNLGISQDFIVRQSKGSNTPKFFFSSISDFNRFLAMVPITFTQVIEAEWKLWGCCASEVQLNGGLGANCPCPHLCI